MWTSIWNFGYFRPGQPAINQYFTNMNNGNTPASSLVNPGTGKMSETPEKNGELNGKSIDKPVDDYLERKDQNSKFLINTEFHT